MFRSWASQGKEMISLCQKSTRYRSLHVVGDALVGSQEGAEKKQEAFAQEALTSFGGVGGGVVINFRGGPVPSASPVLGSELRMCHMRSVKCLLG